MSKLAEMLRSRMETEGLSLREAAARIGVSHSTVDRVIDGETVEVDTLIKISSFLGVPVENLLNVKDSPDEVLQQIVMVASMEPELMEVFSEIAEGVIDGTIDKQVLAEVAAFANYRLDMNKKEQASAKVRKNEEVN